MTVVPCELNTDLQRRIEGYAETLKTEAHKLGNHGLTEHEFYQSGLFRGAIERIRGQFSATMATKREFVQLVLECLQDRKLIRDWESAGSENRHDYTVTMPSGKAAVIELKGCLDGNNTTIFERPAHAHEFILWSICENAASDPRRNVWSGIHTRLSTEIITQEKRVDGLVVWDMLCGTAARPCPKLERMDAVTTAIGSYQVTPPCIYLFPGTVPNVKGNPRPEQNRLSDVEFLAALHSCFGGRDDEINRVWFKVEYKGDSVLRSTTVERGGLTQIESKPTAIRRQ